MSEPNRELHLYQQFLDEQVAFVDQPFNVPREFAERDDSLPSKVLVGFSRRLNIELKKRCLAAFNEQSRAQFFRQIKYNQLYAHSSASTIPVKVPTKDTLSGDWIETFPAEWPVDESSAVSTQLIKRYTTLRERMLRLQLSLKYAQDKHRHYKTLHETSTSLDVPTMGKYLEVQASKCQNELRDVRLAMAQLSAIMKKKTPAIKRQISNRQEQPSATTANSTVLSMLDKA
ncbi:hypothetical protein H4R33_005870 [Dimargaris cristalligena]|uniref:Kinetochore Sim4 complex subunit Fta4 n=1 Tax=Dimargaris cristalligena TaxID=215637 RepID=A0A4P9ZND6_9FUNG|nr:hypothetical protein H4R33_005870 [Dimargaris cristalligena]RKP34793.1 kinetochore Sim4 complex subunit Fta4 [Dimargaris cristalligena]|eukprot:RKP34793.1 kinetochore Sim4 complex subunit Fta4 [Dimargaris cristalligena]